jgi:hypothetical protein
MLRTRVIPLIAAAAFTAGAFAVPAAAASTTAGARPACWGAARCLVATPPPLKYGPQPGNEWGDGARSAAPPPGLKYGPQPGNEWGDG